MSEKIVVAAQVPDSLKDAFERRVPDAEFVFGGPPEFAIPPDARVMIASPRITGIMGEEAPAGWPFALEWIFLISVGIDAYPEWLFDGPCVTSASGTSAVALAEFSLAAIFADAKRIPEIWIDSADDWEIRDINTVAGKTLGILGFGATGKALAPRARAFGMKVVALRRSNLIGTEGVEQSSDIKDLLARSDYLVLAAPSTPETDGILNAESLAHSRPGLHIINIARGSLIDDDALLAALDTGTVRMASLDATQPEPLPAGHRYYSHPNVHLSPHTSVQTEDTLDNLTALFAANFRRFENGEVLTGKVIYERGY